jgi:dTDP-4-dehydrorhamnose reductase
MKIAVFGANGQLGHAVARVGKRRGVSVTGFDRASADITDIGAVTAALDHARADAVINAAAYTAVDKAESDAASAEAVNANGAGHVAAAAAAIGVPLIHISTDYVFDGAKTGAYVEDDPVAPLGVYGRTKAEGEAAVRAANADAAIVRTAWVYGLDGANFVKTMLRLGGEREVLRIVDDQRGSPTFADDLAEALITIAGRPLGGTYHLAGRGQATWFEFARAIFAHAGGRTPRLESITTAEYPTPARRPANSVLDCAKAKRTFAVELPPWDDGLSRMLNAYLGTARA